MSFILGSGSKSKRNCGVHLVESCQDRRITEMIINLELHNHAMPKNRRITVTEDDYSLLRRLASHPQLAAELHTADVVDSAQVPPDVVTMNSRVVFEDETIGERREVTIVFPQQSDASGNRVSVLAPVGTALLGLAAGQTIVWPFPDGKPHSLRVLRIVFQPEAETAVPRRTRRAVASGRS
jgi:regulator of nucleoside diphosphate kinase